MTDFTITDFNLVNSTKSSNTHYVGGFWENLPLSDTFSDSSIDLHRWTSTAGTNTETTFLRQTASNSTTILTFNPLIPQNLDLEFSLDISSIGTGNSAYILFVSGSSRIAIGIKNTAGTNEYWFQSEKVVNGVPVLRAETTSPCLTTTPTIRVIKNLGCFYMYVGTTLVGSDGLLDTFINTRMSLRTTSSGVGAQVDWINLTFAENFSNYSTWNSPLFDGGEALFWKQMTLDGFSIPNDLRVFCRLRTTDDATPGPLDYSRYVVQEFVGATPTAVFENLVPTRRYYQFQLVVQPKQITPIEQQVQQDLFTGDGVESVFELTAVPLDQKVSVYSQGLELNKSEYILDGVSITLITVPVLDTGIIVQYHIPKV